MRCEIEWWTGGTTRMTKTDVQTLGVAEDLGECLI